MTTWEWRIIIALIRYVLSKENVDLGQRSIQEIEEEEREDMNILIEAILREKGR
jgi:hypothetical protein